jgi:hypothetical protein
MLSDLGRTLVFVGVAVVVVGLALMFSDRIPFLGRLPGDIVIRRKNTVFYFPLVTMVIVSILLSIVMHFFNRK